MGHCDSYAKWTSEQVATKLHESAINNLLGVVCDIHGDVIGIAVGQWNDDGSLHIVDWAADNPDARKALLRQLFNKYPNVKVTGMRQGKFKQIPHKMLRRLYE